MASKFYVIRKDYSSVGGGSYMVSSHKTVTAARKAAYSVVKDFQHVERCIIKVGVPKSSLNGVDGMDVGEVTMHAAGAFEGQRFFYPDYHGYYKNAKNRWHKYFLKSNGSLGKGSW